MKTNTKTEIRATAVRNQNVSELESFIYMLIDSYTIITKDKTLRKCLEKFIDRLDEIDPLKIPEGEELKEVYTVYVTKKRE